MKRIESIEDEMNDVVTYELHDGRRIKTSAKMVQLYGAEDAIRRCGGEPFAPGEREKRLPVFHRDREIGTLPPWFDPATTKSTTFLYDPRPGDFVRDGDRWIASSSMGPGDLDAVPDFERKAAESTSGSASPIPTGYEAEGVVPPNLNPKAQGEGGQKKTPPCTAGLPEVAKQNWPEAQSSTTPSGTKIRTDEPFTQAIPHDKICTPTTPPDGEGR
ncbi:hypothetical protein D3C72_1152910 [compost metagenome]